MKSKSIDKCVTGNWFEFKRFHELPTVVCCTKNSEDEILILNIGKSDGVMNKDTVDPKVFNEMFPHTDGYPSIDWG